MEKKTIKILIDTREKKPFTFASYDAEIESKAIDAGDYTVEGYENFVRIERKANANELLGNIGANWARFTREMEKLRGIPYKCIVVSGPDNFNYYYEKGLTKLTPGFAYRQISLLHIEYGVPVYFLANPAAAENFTYRYFLRAINAHRSRSQI